MGAGITPFEVGGTWLSGFSRASTGTFIGADGLVHTAAVNVPRADYSNGFAELLLEPAAVNLCPYSQMIGGGSWSNDYTSAGAALNAAIAPDGSMTASYMTIGGYGADYHSPAFSLTQPVPGQPWSVTISGWFMVSVLGQPPINLLMAGPNLYGFLVNPGLAWKRVSFTQQMQATDTYTRIQFNSGGGATGVNFYVWGLQLEYGNVATSYIPTAATSASRAADIAYIIEPPEQGNLTAVPMRSAAQVLAYLLSIDPDGAVFPDLTDPNAVWPQWLAPMAAEIARFEGLAAEMLPESNPGEATYLLADYQRVLGPDPYGRDLVALTLADQRALALSRWTEKFGVRPADFIAFAASFGVAITIQEYALTEAGCQCGALLVGNPTQFAWLVHLPAVAVEIAEASGASAGDLLGEYAPSLAQAAIAGRAPAHTNPYFSYS